MDAAGRQAGYYEGQRFRGVASVQGQTDHTYTVILEPEPDGGFHAFCPTLKGCHTQGDTLEEALRNIREAIDVYLESLKAHGEPVPVEDIFIKPVTVRV